MKKFAAVNFFRRGKPGISGIAFFDAINQIISLKFTLTLRAVAGGFILPEAVKMGV